MTAAANDTKTDIETKPVTRPLDPAAMKRLASEGGPCITIAVPPRHPGAAEGSRNNQIRSLVHAAQEQLNARDRAGQWSGLLDAILELAGAEGMEAGGRGFVIFRTPSLLERYETLDNHPACAVVGDHFLLAPFIPDAFTPRDYFILGLSRKRLGLYRCGNGECRKLELPAAVPASIEAAEGFDPMEYEAGRSGGAGGDGTVHFGTRTDRDTAPQYLKYFFDAVDRELGKCLEGKPLLLAGVHEEVSAYRLNSRYKHIPAAEIRGNVESLPLKELAARAAEAFGREYQEAGEEVLTAWHELKDRNQTVLGIADVLRVARQGRIHKLCVAARAEEDADLASSVNAAVALTLANGGNIFSVTADRLPQSLAAILRY